MQFTIVSLTTVMEGSPGDTCNFTFKCTIQLLTVSMTIACRLATVCRYLGMSLQYLSFNSKMDGYTATLLHEQVTKVIGQIVTKSALCAFVIRRHVLNAGCIM